MKRLISAFILLWLAQAIAFAAGAQITCKGTVVDEEGEPIIGASIVITGGRALASTDVDGDFSVKVPEGTRSLSISYVGYKTCQVAVKSQIGTIKMEPSNEILNDVVVTQSLAKTRQTPVALSQVNRAEIDIKLGTQELPEILNTTPGVWATKDGGGFGDSKINMRGFKNENVAVLVNGIPVNDMEGGKVYWSNWAGLGDVTSNIQTQRGLGAAVLSAPSLGGTINITTAGLDAQKGGTVWYGMGNDGLNEYGIKLSTGMLKHGWAITVLGSRKWGDGYIQGTAFSGWNYFVNVSKRINDRHQLSLTAFGAPQEHDQRKGNLSIKNYQLYAKDFMGNDSPYKYNPVYGFDLNGQQRTSAHNVYHKPQISLAHIWQIDKKSSLSTTAYVSLAKGGGYSGQGRGTYKGQSLSYSTWRGAYNGDLEWIFRKPDGTFAYDEVQLMNQASETGSNMVMGMSNNSHNWYGLISTYQNSFWDKKLNFLAGIDVRYYEGLHDNKIIDLYNGAYYMDDTSRDDVKPENNYRAADPNWLYEKLGVGDIVYRDYTGYTQQEGVFVQGELSLLKKRLNLLLSGSISNTAYKRVDRFYYDEEHGTTPWYSFWGGTVKFGANFNIDRYNNVFANVGYISRAPYFRDGVFLSQETSNAVNPDPLNEKVFSAEIGYNYRSRNIAVGVNAYYTKWMDKTSVKSGVIQVGELTGQRYTLNLAGVNARHMGIEIDVLYSPVKWFEAKGMLSLGDYTWDSNAKGYFYNALGQPIKDTAGNLASGILAPDHAWGILNQKGTKVGGSAQTTAAIGVTFRPFEGFRIGADWKVSDRNYSDYSLNTPGVNQTINLANPWRIPWGNQLDLNASYRFRIGGVEATIFGNVHNLLNYNYVVDAYSNSAVDADWDNIYGVYYCFGRTYSAKLRIKF